MKTYLMIGIILNAVAIILLAVSQIIYQQKIDAFDDAALNWAKHPSNDTAPTLEQFGLTTEIIYINLILRQSAVALILIGIVSIACSVIIFVRARKR